jgi:hypothetical protein
MPLRAQQLHREQPLLLAALVLAELWVGALGSTRAGRPSTKPGGAERSAALSAPSRLAVHAPSAAGMGRTGLWRREREARASRPAREAEGRKLAASLQVLNASGSIGMEIDKR